VRRFLFKLAGHLGRTVADLERGLSSSELSEWIAYDQLDRIPDPWEQTGTVCATVANLWTDKGGYRPDDFIPRPRRAARILDARAGLAWMRGVASGVAAKFARGQPSPPSAGSRSA
jgi:hypothetical protein